MHCAVIGGNLNLLRWLVDTQLCPIKDERAVRRRNSAPSRSSTCSTLTSNGRSMMDLAMTGKPKMGILKYLVVEKGMSVCDSKDPKLSQLTLDALLRCEEGADISREMGKGDGRNEIDYLKVREASAASFDSLQDACALCCERAMDCVLIPCGHQICCVDCGHHLSTCPVCKVNCSILRIFRQ